MDNNRSVKSVSVRVLLTLLIATGFAIHGKASDEMSNGGSDAQSGRRAFESSDYRTALRILGAAAEKNPGDPEIQFLLARTHFELNEFDAAIGASEKAVALSSQNSVYHEWLGRSYGEKADRSGWLSALSLAKKARQEFEIANHLDKKNFSAFQALIEFDCTAPGVAGGGEDKARREIAELAALDPTEGHYAAGNCRRQKKDFAAADREFDLALTHAKSADLVFDIGDYAARHGQADRLLAVAKAGQVVAPGDVRAKFYRAAALIIKNQNLQEAETLLREYASSAPVRTGYPRPAMVHVWVGKLREDEGKSGEALKEYEAAAKLDPKNKMAQEALKKSRKS